MTKPDTKIELQACIKRVMENPLLRFNDPFRVSSMLEQEFKHLLATFFYEINMRAEEKMILTLKLEGSHYAAMREVLDRLGIIAKRNPGDGQK